MRFIFKRDLSLTLAAWIGLLTSVTILSLVIYGVGQAHLQKAQFDAYSNTDILHDFCRQEAQLNADECMVSSEGGRRLSDEAIWILLQSADILNTRDVPSPYAMSVDSAPPKPIAALATFLSADLRGNEDGIALVQSAAALCNIGKEHGSNGGRQAVIRLFAGLDQRGGEGAISWLAANSIGDSATLESNMIERLRFEKPVTATDAEIISALVFYGGGYDQGADNIDEQPAGQSQAKDKQALRTDSNCPSALEKFNGLNLEVEDRYAILSARVDLAMYLASQLHRSEAVAESRGWLTLFTGYEQFGLLAVFLFASILALGRLGMVLAQLFRNRLSPGPTPEGEDSWGLDLLGLDRDSQWSHWRAQMIGAIRSARSPIKTAALLLPAIGFIGTVRGIMNSLNGAGELVFADNLNERAAEIGALAGDLGLAFATTFLALLGSLVLTVILAIETRFVEVSLLRRLDQAGSGAPRKVDDLGTEEGEKNG